MRKTILLVDDHAMFREGLRSLIERSGMFQVIAEAGDGVEAVRLAGELKPDIIVMDLTMPTMNGIEATREITKKYPSIRVVALSMESNRFFVVEVLKVGASGYIMKDTAFAELLNALNIVAKGETYLPHKIMTLLVREFLQCILQDVSFAYQNLTPREMETLQLVADGKSNKEIAFQLGVSGKTADNLRHAVMQKLNLFSIAELTKYAIKHGLSTLIK